ncbi:efflux RND transporter permease subunit, partial [Pseudomonas viridiflava]|uniref:efflux RND transporter permease subunit n=1 Tax=Pseudomonas viridiflava TaxID=33069 RepID=UPI0013C2F08C
IKPGRVIVQVTAYDSVKDLPALWQRLRAKVGELSGSFPPGTQGPLVDDVFARVAVASVAVTAPGFNMSEMRGPIKRLRDQLYGLSGVDQVELYGLQDERIYLDFDHQTLGAYGLAPQQVLQQLQAQNAIALGGNPVVGAQSTTLSVSGEILSLEQLRRFPAQLASGERVP